MVLPISWSRPGAPGFDGVIKRVEAIHSGRKLFLGIFGVRRGQKRAKTGIRIATIGKKDDENDEKIQIQGAHSPQPLSKISMEYLSCQVTRIHRKTIGKP
jgi:hypothetical protein